MERQITTKITDEQIKEQSDFLLSCYHGAISQERILKRGSGTFLQRGIA